MPQRILLGTLKTFAPMSQDSDADHLWLVWMTGVAMIPCARRFCLATKPRRTASALAPVVGRKRSVWADKRAAADLEDGEVSMALKAEVIPALFDAQTSKCIIRDRIQRLNADAQLDSSASGRSVDRRTKNPDEERERVFT